MKLWLFIICTAIATQGWAERDDSAYYYRQNTTQQGTKPVYLGERIKNGFRKIFGRRDRQEQQKTHFPPAPQKTNTSVPAYTTPSHTYTDSTDVNALARNAQLYIEIDKNPDIQKMKVYKRNPDGSLPKNPLYEWPVSTGANTPAYNFKNPNFGVSCKVTITSPEDQNFIIDARRLKPVHKSTQWSGANMYNSVFFGCEPGKEDNCIDSNRSGYAIHGIDPGLEPYLGKPASGGCVRISKENSNTLMSLVQQTIGMNGFDDPNFRNSNSKAVQIRVTDSSSPQAQQKIKNECNRANIINKCVKSKLQTYYPIGMYDAENSTEQTKRQDLEATVASPNPNSTTTELSFLMGNEYPHFMSDSSYDHAKAVAWLNQGNGFNYKREYVYKVQNGQIGSPYKAFRIYNIPDQLEKHFREECAVDKAAELAAFDKAHPPIVPPEDIPIPTRNPRLLNPTPPAINTQATGNAEVNVDRTSGDASFLFD